MNNNVFNLELIKKYSTQGPRYTSYPTALQFHDKFDENIFIKFIEKSNKSGRDLSLYAHIPFCAKVCFFCGCNKIITKNRQQATGYLDYMEKEIKTVASKIDKSRKVVQLHWGGGTPTFLSNDEQWRLMNIFKDNFNFADDSIGEYSIEIDPRTVTTNSVSELRKMGFNRLSFGVQDFDGQVQLAVNRVQSEEETKMAIDEGRRQKFHSISVDLIYGLPLQTKKSFIKTIDKIIELSPDRIAVFNYAHLPHIFKTQNLISNNKLPIAQEKLNMLEISIKRLMDAGYVFIGLDHFAKPTDSLVKHQKNGTLYRNFQGYSTFSNCDLFGFGLSSISQVGESYSQNIRTRDEYYETLDKGKLPTIRGVELTNDDIIRRKVITEIMCNMTINWDKISCEFNIDAKKYFSSEIEKLKEMHNDNLLSITDYGFNVKEPGRLLIRNIAMLFDTYLEKVNPKSFSKVI